MSSINYEICELLTNQYVSGTFLLTNKSISKLWMRSYFINARIKRILFCGPTLKAANTFIHLLEFAYTYGLGCFLRRSICYGTLDSLWSLKTNCNSVGVSVSARRMNLNLLFQTTTTASAFDCSWWMSELNGVALYRANIFTLPEPR